MSFDYPEIGSLLGGKYLIKSIIGKGATAQVYKVEHKYLQINLAVKVLAPELANKDKKAEDVFFDEAASLAQMDHKNLIRIYDAEKNDGYSCISMEYVNGKTVDALIKENGLISPLKAVKIIIESCKALDYSLKYGLVHRDIKPGNIMVVNDDCVKIIDFGLSKKIGQPVKYQIIGGPMCGTLYYMAPEQLTDSDRVDHKADIYGLGCTLYHMIIGKVPFETNDLSALISMHMGTTPPVPSEVSDKVSKDLSDVIMKTLEKNPLKRYQTYDELIADLEKVLANNTPITTHEAEKMNSLLINDSSFILSNLKEKYLKKTKDRAGDNEPESLEMDNLQNKFIKNTKPNNSAKLY